MGKIFTSISITLLLITISSCASYDKSSRIVQQGNLLPESKVRQLHQGMSKRDVAALMGTSLISPMFNNDRWDYAYTWRKGSGVDDIKYVAIYFQNDEVSMIKRGDKKPDDSPVQDFARFLRFSLGHPNKG